MDIIMQLPSYQGEEKWTHFIDDSWSLDIVLRDSPIVDTLTIGCVCIIGLLCGSSSMKVILKRPEIRDMTRAEQLNTMYLVETL